MFESLKDVYIFDAQCLKLRQTYINHELSDFFKTKMVQSYDHGMDLLPDTQICGLRMRQECRECFPLSRHHRKPLVSDPGMHHDTCATHVPWYMSGSLTRGGGENVPGIPGECAARNFAYLVRSPWEQKAEAKYKLCQCCSKSAHNTYIHPIPRFISSWHNWYV